ncbi:MULTISPECIES: chaperone NapD [Serratia]|uniref:Chaperone NapD n=2 Tax=Serratia rubidaea TaxID=61652 RepID=A0ABS0MIQ4_SERRU|nr:MULTISPECIES: chaperone NapD [Serratia]MBH1932249.1 chaperone NapD [Serratia rubidaea]MBS0975819.1 chaperone NapD [Serratia rubidaea]MCR0996840.1 chaperone NapD [Serratia rubidaea]MDC6109833.1 chaperone NapD [Serratia rubidaea]MDC6118037.1 chaperone NapD [Serratia rubidaea]
MMNNEWHVSGLLVQARPAAFSQLVPALLAIPETEIAAQDREQGKLAVVMQAAHSRALLEKIESARNLEGVLAVSLVYHQQDEQGEVMP